MVIKSSFGSIDWKDFVKGLLTAVLTAVLTFMYEAIHTGGLTDINWMVVLKIGLAAGIGYILKNWLTNKDDKFLVSDKK